MSIVHGTVYFGINNIYAVRIDRRDSTGHPTAGEQIECRIKGKILDTESDVYNPIATGDRVEIEIDLRHPGQGMILSRLPRKNAFQRWNRKRNAPQTVCANIDLIVCVASPKNPPFRPRFVDRVLVSAAPDIPVLVLMNKSDLGVSAEIERRLTDYRRIGYECMTCSALTGEGIPGLRQRLAGLCVGFVGQSGVGKSSVLNRLVPGIGLRVGELSTKYDRGRHTTNYTVMIESGEGTIVDTPGIREIEVCGIDAADLWSYFPEIADFSANCAFSSCLHDGEPDCAVRKAVEKGLIHPDRYESYVRLLEDIRLRDEYAYT